MHRNISVRFAIGYMSLSVVCGCTMGSTGAQAASPASGADAASAPVAASSTIPEAKTPALAILTDVCPVSNVPSTYEFAFLIPLAIAAGGALINAIVPPLINSATSSVADHLQDRANGVNASSTAFVNGTLFLRSNENGHLGAFKDRYGCLVFVRGGLAGSGTPQPSQNWSSTYYTKVNNALSKAGISGLQLVTTPEVYAEFNIFYQRVPLNPKSDQAPTGGTQSYMYQAVGFAPVYLDYEKTGAARSSNESKQLIFKLVLTANPIQSTNPSGTTILNQVVDLGDIKFPSVKQTSDLIYKTPQFAKIPQPSTTAVKSSNGKTIEGYIDDAVPISVQVSLTETEDAGDVERAVAASLISNESNISNAITQAIVNQLQPSKAK
jgi:hypothetical protein